MQDGHQSISQRSHSNNYGSSYRSKSDSDEYGNLIDEDVKIPNFDDVNVPSKKSTGLTIEAPVHLTGEPSEKSLNRNLSQKRLNDIDNMPAPNPLKT